MPASGLTKARFASLGPAKRARRWRYPELSSFKLTMGKLQMACLWWLENPECKMDHNIASAR